MRTSVEVAAPPERVFRALTDPAELARWWGGGRGGDGPGDGPGVREADADLRPGGRWRVRVGDADGRAATVGGTYRVVDPPHTIETTWEADGDRAPSTVRYELTPTEVGGAPGTRVTVTHTTARATARPTSRPTPRAAPRPAWARRPRRAPSGWAPVVC